MIALTEAPADAPEILFLGETPRNSYVEGALSTGFRMTKLHSGQPLAGSEPERLDQEVVGSGNILIRQHWNDSLEGRHERLQDMSAPLAKRAA